jgi:hypothetical protein
MSLELILTDSVKTSLYSTASSYDFDDPTHKNMYPKMFFFTYLDLIEVKKVFFAHEIILHFKYEY